MTIAEIGTRRIWIERILYGLMIAFMTLALIFAAAAVFQAYFNEPPVHVVSQDKPPTEPLCPGALLSISNSVTVDEPTVLFLYVSVMDEEANYNIPDTITTLGPRLHPHPSSFQQYIVWQVPELPAGKYNRVFAIRGHDTEEDPVLMLLPFVVDEDC